jgi:hypothetical protein
MSLEGKIRLGQGKWFMGRIDVFGEFSVKTKT